MDRQSSPLSGALERTGESSAQGTNSPACAQYVGPTVRPFDPDALSQPDVMELTQLRIRNLVAHYFDARTCASGRHTWLDPVSRARCCNGWHQELRVAPAQRPTPAEYDTGGATLVSSMLDEGVMVWRVWVRDEQAGAQ